CVHLRQRRDLEGQTHFFLKPACVVEVFVPYSESFGPPSIVEQEQVAVTPRTGTPLPSHPAPRRCEATGSVELE
ncbi:MAG: hypothetical protein ACYC0X_34985, partial [Pirellulaceae bacterium]